MSDCEHNKEIIYNVWDAPRKTRRYKNELLRFYRILDYIPKNVKNVLDLGCGTGYMSVLMKKHKMNVTSIDISTERLKYFKENVGNLDIKLLHKNFFELEDTGYDFLVCQEVIEHMEDYNILVAKIHSLLREGGYAIITTPYNEDLSKKTKK